MGPRPRGYTLEKYAKMDICKAVGLLYSLEPSKTVDSLFKLLASVYDDLNQIGNIFTHLKDYRLVPKEKENDNQNSSYLKQQK